MADTRERSDAELLERWRAGDPDAGEVLFDRYYEPLERFFMNKVSGGVADLVQDTLQACVAARDRIADTGKFRSYLFSIAYNTLRSHLRARYRRGEDIDVDAISVTDLAPGPSSVLARRREERLLLDGLRAIPIADQVLLELFYWEDMDTAEIGTVLGRPRGTVKRHLVEARARLERAMARLADSAALLDSTLTDLPGWAAACRALLGGDNYQ